MTFTVNQNHHAHNLADVDLHKRQTTTESPSIYSTASAGSLDSELGGPWRMVIQDSGFDFNLDFDFSINDLNDSALALGNPSQWELDAMLSDEGSRDIDMGQHVFTPPMLEWYPPHTAFNEQQTGSYQLTVDPTAANTLHDPTFDSGLLDMIVNPRCHTPKSTNQAFVSNKAYLMQNATHNDIAIDTCSVPSLKRKRDAAIKPTKGECCNQTQEEEEQSLDFIRSRLAEVVNKVQKAVGGLPRSAETKRIRKAISMSAAEVCDFTQLLEKQTMVEGMILEEDKAVVVLSSDSSEGSENRGNKR